MMAAIKFVITLPDDFLILAIGVPHLGAVPAAVTASGFTGKGMDATVVFPALAALLHFPLNHLEGVRVDDGLMSVLYEILRQLTVVLAGLFADGVKHVFLLEEQVPCVSDIFVNGPNGAIGEMHPLHRLHTHLLQLFFRCLCG